MEVSQGTHESSKFAQQDFDFISNMPDNVVTNILDRMPIQDAVGTGILSRNWRFKWHMLSQLVLDYHFRAYLSKTKYENDYGKIVSRLLFSLKGAITKFSLCTYKEEQCYDEDIAHWILFFSRKGVQDLTIWNCNADSLVLPFHLYLCLELKHLSLYNCCFVPPVSFLGFPNLLSLGLDYVQLKKGKFGEFFTQCPVLEILTLGYSDYHGQVKLVEIAKLTNLKILSLFLCNLDNTMITSSSDIFELVGFLPKLQELNLDFLDYKTFTEYGATNESTFHCLKSLNLSYINLDIGVMLSFAFEIIRSSPNLHTLDIIVCKQDAGVAPLAACSFEADYNTMKMLQLRSVVFSDLKGSENEVCLIKYLLACSPFLKNMDIHLLSTINSEEKLLFAKKLLKLDRASPVAKIILL